MDAAKLALAAMPKAAEAVEMEGAVAIEAEKRADDKFQWR